MTENQEELNRRFIEEFTTLREKHEYHEQMLEELKKGLLEVRDAVQGIKHVLIVLAAALLLSGGASAKLAAKLAELL